MYLVTAKLRGEHAAQSWPVIRFTKGSVSGKGTVVLSLHLWGKGHFLLPARDKGWKFEKEEK